MKISTVTRASSLRAIESEFAYPRSAYTVIARPRAVDLKLALAISMMMMMMMTTPRAKINPKSDAEGMVISEAFSTAENWINTAISASC